MMLVYTGNTDTLLYISILIMRLMCVAPGEDPNEEHVHRPLLGVPLQPVCGHALQDAVSLPQLHAGL